MKLIMAGINIGVALVETLIYIGIEIKEPTLLAILCNIGFALFFVYDYCDS